MAGLEIAGCNPKNVGDLLMLEAAVRELRARRRGLSFAVRRRSIFRRVAPDLPLRYLPLVREAGSRIPLKQALNRWALEPASRLLGAWPGWCRAQAVRGLVDVCGYKYGGLWGTRAIRDDLRVYGALKRRGWRVVLLPKTYGPFPDAGSREAMRELLSSVDLCLARDPVSQAHLLELGLKPEECPVFPDYTTTVPGVVLPQHERLAGRPVIIPNFRMVDAGVGLDAAAYVTRLRVLSRAFRARIGPPILLVHDSGRDRELCAELARAEGLETVEEERAVAVKGILRGAAMVYADRLHGLLGALSQAVPAFTTGWSYKYEEALRTFEAAALRLPLAPHAAEAVEERVREVWERREEWGMTLRAAAERLRSTNAVMWDRVAAVLFPADPV